MTDVTDTGASAPPDGSSEAAIFISHVEEDADVALRIADALEEHGYPTWCYERDAVPGPSYLLQTARQIEESAAVVLLISPASLGSHQVTAEVVRAHESARPFIPILIGISHVEFGTRQPEWREALGSSTSIALPAEGVDAILPRICGGLRGLGLTPSDAPVPRVHRVRVPQPPPPIVRGDRAPITRKVALAGAAAALVIVAVAVGLVIAGGGGGSGGGDGGAREEGAQAAQSQTSTSAVSPAGEAAVTPAPAGDAPAVPAPTVAPPAPTATVAGQASPPPAAASAPATTPAPTPVPTTAAGPAFADDTSIATSAGAMDVLDVSITDEWCSVTTGECMTASGAERYLVLVLVPADGSLGSTDGFAAEANGSSVSYSGGQAGANKVDIDGETDIIEIVYVVPANAADGDVTLRWPGNNPLLLTVS